MAEVTDIAYMRVAANSGETYSYGRVTISERKFLSHSSLFEYSKGLFSSVPLQSIVKSGSVVHIQVDSPEVNSKILNPCYISEIESNNTKRPIHIVSSDGKNIVHRTSKLVNSVDSKDTISVGENSDQIVYECDLSYNLLPDEYICQHFDISPEIVSKIL